ncbi:MAG: transposase [Tenuifilaceae bacterium]
MKHQIPIEYGKFYHIYNRGNNSENLFLNSVDYNHFLSLYEKYINLVADTYAWCLMPNHFHILVRIKDETDIGFLKPKRGQTTPPKKAVPENQFSHLFNAYAKGFNTKNNRHGSLFEHPFKRLEVTTEDYLRKLVYYIHANPVKHGYTENMFEYPWSSFLTIMSIKPAKLSKETVIEWFDNQTNFIAYHQDHQETDLEKDYFLE